MSAPIDTWLLDCIEFADGHVDIRRTNVKFEGDDHYTPAWYVGGAGLGGATHRSLREALLSWAEGLRACAEHDPEHFGRFADMPTLDTESLVE